MNKQVAPAKELISASHNGIDQISNQLLNSKSSSRMQNSQENGYLNVKEVQLQSRRQMNSSSIFM